MKKNLITYYFLNISCAWAINFHIELCKLETKNHLLTPYFTKIQNKLV